jgi:hypothetical protein
VGGGGGGANPKAKGKGGPWKSCQQTTKSNHHNS